MSFRAYKLKKILICKKIFDSYLVITFFKDHEINFQYLFLCFQFVKCVERVRYYVRVNALKR